MSDKRINPLSFQKPKRKLVVKRKEYRNTPNQQQSSSSTQNLSLSSTSQDMEEKKEEINNTNGEYDLFNNPFVEAAKRSLSQEDIDNYKKLGEKFYSGWSFENGGPEHILDVALAEIVEAIKSGLHPSDLDDNEKEILKTKMGDEWYLNFGFEEQDLETIRV